MMLACPAGSTLKNSMTEQGIRAVCQFPTGYLMEPEEKSDVAEAAKKGLGFILGLKTSTVAWLIGIALIVSDYWLTKTKGGCRRRTFSNYWRCSGPAGKAGSVLSVGSGLYDLYRAVKG
jgi:hypothetical protein